MFPLKYDTVLLKMRTKKKKKTDQGLARHPAKDHLHRGNIQNHLRDGHGPYRNIIGRFIGIKEGAIIVSLAIVLESGRKMNEISHLWVAQGKI